MFSISVNLFLFVNHFSSVLSRVQLFVTPWIAARQASLFVNTFICIFFFSLDPTCKWYISVFCLAYFMCMITSNPSMLLQMPLLHSFYVWVIFCSIYTHHIFFIHPSVDVCWGCFHVLAVTDSAAMNTGVHISFWIMVFSRYMSRSKILVLYCLFFSFFQEPHAVFHSGYTNLHFYKQCRRVPFSPHFASICYLYTFWFWPFWPDQFDTFSGTLF